MPIPSTRMAQTVNVQGRLRVAPNAPFFLVFNPRAEGSWTCEAEGLDKPTYLPDLRICRLQPGTNGVRDLQPGEEGTPGEAYRRTLADMYAKGLIVLDPHELTIEAEHLPAGVEAGAYIREVPTTRLDAQRRPLPYHHLAHELVKAPAVQGQSVSRKLDRESWNRWRLHLVESGVLPPPSEELLEIDRARVARKQANAQGDTKSHPEVREQRVSRHAQRLAQLDAAVRPAPKAPAKPKRRRS
ncbi:MAG: hypothetical protein ACPG1A_14640 [Halioglobus sp.]